MIRFDRRDQFFAILLSALAGYVDAIGFLKTGGFFVSFMSGNSTRFAVGLVRGVPSAYVAAGLIGAFVIGVMFGTTISEQSGGRPRAVLLAVAFLLAVAAGADFVGLAPASIFIIAAAMGAENATFAREGDVQIGLTYMTGTLVKFAQRLAQALKGRRSTGWFAFLLLWLGLVGGCVAGAFVYDLVGLAGLWLAAGSAAVLSFYTPGLGPLRQP